MLMSTTPLPHSSRTTCSVSGLMEIEDSFLGFRLALMEVTGSSIACMSVVYSPGLRWMCLVMV